MIVLPIQGGIDAADISLPETLPYDDDDQEDSQAAIPYEDQNDEIFEAYYDDNQRRSQLPSSNPSVHDVHSTLVSQSVLGKRRR